MISGAKTNFLFSAELGRRLEVAGHRSISVAADPGFVRTELGTKDASRTQRLVMRVSFLIVASHLAETGGPTTQPPYDR